MPPKVCRFSAATAFRVRPAQRATLNPLGQRQPMEVNNMLIVSFETYERTATVSVRPSSENKHTLGKSDEMAEGVVGRVRTSVVGIGTPEHERRGCARMAASRIKTVRIKLDIGARVRD